MYLTTCTHVVRYSYRIALVHITLCFRFGPLRHQWCMRPEGKNSQIKKLVGKNFYLPKTVAERHQRYMYLQLLSSPGTSFTNYLYSGDSIGKGVYMCVALCMCMWTHSTYIHVVHVCICSVLSRNIYIHVLALTHTCIHTCIIICYNCVCLTQKGCK